MSDIAALDDAELLRRHANGGDKDAFGELFRRHRERLWAVALRTLANREEAADALQDAMIKAYRAAPRFRGDSAVTTWLHRIVVNACLDRVRRQQSRSTVPLSPELPDPPARDGDPSDRVNVLAVRDALEELSFEHRAVVVYLDMLGYPVAEVAQILEIAPGTVKSRASRARANLAILLSDDGNQRSNRHVTSSRPPKGRQRLPGDTDGTEPGGPQAGFGKEEMS